MIQEKPTNQQTKRFAWHSTKNYIEMQGRILKCRLNEGELLIFSVGRKKQPLGLPNVYVGNCHIELGKEMVLMTKVQMGKEMD